MYRTDAIRARRLNTLSSIYAWSEGEIERYTTAALEGEKICRAKFENPKPKTSFKRKKRTACDNLQAGILLRALATVGLFPVPYQREYRSVQDVRLEWGAIHSSRHEGVEGDGSHSVCNGLLGMNDGFSEHLDQLEGIKLSDFMPTEAMFLQEYNGGLSYLVCYSLKTLRLILRQVLICDQDAWNQRYGERAGIRV